MPDLPLAGPLLQAEIQSPQGQNLHLHALLAFQLTPPYGFLFSMLFDVLFFVEIKLKLVSCYKIHSYVFLQSYYKYILMYELIGLNLNTTSKFCIPESFL